MARRPAVLVGQKNDSCADASAVDWPLNRRNGRTDCIGEAESSLICWSASAGQDEALLSTVIGK